MDASISACCASISAFFSHLQSPSDSLRRRPIPLDSAAAVDRLDQRVATAGADLELLEDMAMGTVSVAKLLGHCGEVYRRNHAYADLLQDRLAAFGYLPDKDSDDGDTKDFDADPKVLSPENGFEQRMPGYGSALGPASARWRLDEDLMYPSVDLPGHVYKF